jgi:hypothetical protein
MTQLADLITKFVQHPQARERFEICTKCEKFNPHTDKCGVCGCLMTIKTFIPIFHCPENKW